MQRFKNLLEKPLPGQSKGLLNFLVFYKETNITSGEERIMGPDPAAWTNDECTVDFRGLTNADGVPAANATAEGWKENAPKCSFVPVRRHIVAGILPHLCCALQVC